MKSAARFGESCAKVPQICTNISRRHRFLQPELEAALPGEQVLHVAPGLEGVAQGLRELRAPRRVEGGGRAWGHNQVAAQECSTAQDVIAL